MCVCVCNPKPSGHQDSTKRQACICIAISNSSRETTPSLFASMRLKRSLGESALNPKPKRPKPRRICEFKGRRPRGSSRGSIKY